METEIEAKWIAPDLTTVRQHLQKMGAKLLAPERLMRRKNFDFSDGRLEKIGGWIRVRDEGDIVTLAYKQLNERSLRGTKEIAVVVSEFDKACRLLESIGFVVKSYQETKREIWHFKNCQITLDTWPWIPSVVEIEGENEKDIRQVSEVLGFDWSEALYGSIENVYQTYYNVTEIEVDDWPEITFVPVPAWLEAKRK